MTKKILNLVSYILQIIAFVLLIIVLLRGGFQNQVLKIIVICSLSISVVANIISLILEIKNARNSND